MNRIKTLISSHRRISAAAVAGIAGFGVLLGWLLWPSGGHAKAASRARQYTAADACLLTGEAGVGDPAAAPVWAGMEDASQVTHAKVSFLPVVGPDDAGNARPFATTLVQRKCSVIITYGSARIDAVKQDALAFPGTKFAVIGDQTGSVPANVDQLTGAEAGAERAQVKEYLVKVLQS